MDFTFSHVAEQSVLFVVVCHRSVIFHDATLEGFRDRSYSEVVQSNVQCHSHQIDSPILQCRNKLCTVLQRPALYGDDCMPLVMRSSPTLSITLHHCPLLHQGGTVSEAISW